MIGIVSKANVYKTMKGGVRVAAMDITIANPLSPQWRKGFETEP